MSPIIYFISAFLAIISGLIALFVFALWQHCMKSMIQNRSGRQMMEFIGIVVAVLFSYQSIGWWWKENVWTTGVFLLFPALAIISGWIALVIGWNKTEKDG